MFDESLDANLRIFIVDPTMSNLLQQIELPMHCSERIVVNPLLFIVLLKQLLCLQFSLDCRSDVRICVFNHVTVTSTFTPNSFSNTNKKLSSNVL